MTLLMVERLGLYYILLDFCINVAVCEVILEGRVMKGKNMLEYIP